MRLSVVLYCIAGVVVISIKQNQQNHKGEYVQWEIKCTRVTFQARCIFAGVSGVMKRHGFASSTNKPVVFY